MEKFDGAALLKAASPMAQDLTITSPLMSPAILINVMEHMTDFPSLFNLVLCCRTARLVFEQHPKNLINNILNALSQELQQLARALIAFNEIEPTNKKGIKILMLLYLGSDMGPLPHQFADPTDTLRKLADTFAAINAFTVAISERCVEKIADFRIAMAARKVVDYMAVTWYDTKHPLRRQTTWSEVKDDTCWWSGDEDLPKGPQELSLPLQESETYRVQRALLRYEVFCALFHLSRSRDFDVRSNHQDYQHKIPLEQRRFCAEQVTFFNDYTNPWEVGEMAVIHQSMMDFVKEAYAYLYWDLHRKYERLEKYGGGYGDFGSDKHRDHRMIKDEFEANLVYFTSQSLSFLHRIYKYRKSPPEVARYNNPPPLFRHVKLFLPAHMCAESVRNFSSHDPDEDPSWKPRRRWPDTAGFELPSKGWLAKNPSDYVHWWEREEIPESYWGDMWSRKTGYLLWDR